LAPGESRRFEVSIEAHANAESLAAAQRAVAAIQGDAKPKVCAQPAPEWSTT